MSDLSGSNRNRQVVAQYWEKFWTNGNIQAVDEYCSDDFTVFYPMHGQSVGKAAAKQMLVNFKEVRSLQYIT